MLMAVLMGSGCADEKTQARDSRGLDTSVPLEIANELDTQFGQYHLEISYDPDPPVVGEGTIEIRITFVNSNPDLQGAAVVGANVTVQAEHTQMELEFDSPITLAEFSLGSYQADLIWPEEGLWALTVEVGAAEQTDFARLGVLVSTE